MQRPEALVMRPWHWLDNFAEPMRPRTDVNLTPPPSEPPALADVGLRSARPEVLLWRAAPQAA